MNLANTLQLLLSGTHICQWGHPQAHSYIINDRQNVELGLGFHDLRLIESERSGAFYAVYKKINAQTSVAIRKQQSEIHSAIRPIVGLMSLISETTGTDSIISAGHEIIPAQFSTYITNSSSSQEKLSTICKHPSVKQRKKLIGTIDDKVRSVFDFLTRIGLITLSHKEREIYVVTGKIDYIYAVLEFLDERYEVVANAEVKPTQQGLF